MTEALPFKSDSVPALFGMIGALRPIRENLWHGFFAGMLIFAAAFLLQYVCGPLLGGAPFAAFFGAILIATLVGGLRIGLLISVMCFAAGWYFFLRPYQSWTLQGERGMGALLMYWIPTAALLYIVDGLNRAVDAFAAERDRVGVLFGELQHRVANNMMFLAGLLRLQRRAMILKPDSHLEVLDQAQLRLETMARIHRRLYDTEMIHRPLISYLEGLTTDILDAAGARNVACVVEVALPRLDLPRLMNLSLLVHELVTNSLRHGFEGCKGGKISIKLAYETNNLVLCVSDNGKGYFADPNAKPSLGTNIIRSLSAQLGGEATWLSSGGTIARVVFPATPPRWGTSRMSGFASQ